MSATLSGNGRPDATAEAKLSLTLTGRNDDATALLALYGLPVAAARPDRAGQTGLSVKGNTVRGPRDVVLSLSAGDFSAEFNGTTRLVDGGMTAKGKAKLDAPTWSPG